MLWTADVSAATMAKPSPTNPNTHSIFDSDLCFNWVWVAIRLYIVRIVLEKQAKFAIFGLDLPSRGRRRTGMKIYEEIEGKLVK